MRQPRPALRPFITWSIAGALAALLAFVVATATGPRDAFASAPGTQPTPPPLASTDQTLTNDTGQAANALRIRTGARYLDLVENAAGCPEPRVIQGFPRGPDSLLEWDEPCVDPGEAVVVRFTSDCIGCAAPPPVSVYAWLRDGESLTGPSRTPSPTPRPTPPPSPPTGPDFPGRPQRLLNDTGRAADGLHAAVPDAWLGLSANAPGCDQPEIAPRAGHTGERTFTWPDPCVDPTESVTLQILFDCVRCAAPDAAVLVTWLRGGEPLAAPELVRIGTRLPEPVSVEPVVRVSTDGVAYGPRDRVTVTLANEGGTRAVGSDPLCDLRLERRAGDAWEEIRPLAPRALSGLPACRPFTLSLAPGQSRNEEASLFDDPGEYRLAYRFNALGVEGLLTAYSEPFAVLDE